jgi:hypothetical protein
MDGQNKIVGVVGRKGSGKSTIFRRIVERSPRLFVFDSCGEHSDWIPNTSRTLEGANRFLGWASLQDLFAGSFVPEDDVEGSFDQIALWIYEQGGMTLGVEEIPFLCDATHVPPALDRIVRLGRHREVNMVYTGQRMAEIARRLTAATDVFVLFQHTEPRDVEAIADRCGAEIAQQVLELPMHGYLVWDAIARKTSKSAQLPRV